MGAVEPYTMMGLQPTGPTRVNLEVIVPSPTGLTPAKWKQTATLCPLDWPSNYSLLRLWHTTKSFHHFFSSSLADVARLGRPQGGALPVISPELTSELLHCLSTLPDPWPLAKITIDMEKPSQWVSKLCRLYFADEYARRTVGLPSATHVPDIETALQAVQKILPIFSVQRLPWLPPGRSTCLRACCNWD